MTCSPEPSPASASTSRAVKATRATRSAARRTTSAEWDPAVSTKQCSAASASIETSRSLVPPSAPGTGLRRTGRNHSRTRLLYPTLASSAD
eukprot:1062737-Alexandrium_andersonii.AAC.1